MTITKSIRSSCIMIGTFVAVISAILFIQAWAFGFFYDPKMENYSDCSPERNCILDNNTARAVTYLLRQGTLLEQHKLMTVWKNIPATFTGKVASIDARGLVQLTSRKIGTNHSVSVFCNFDIENGGAEMANFLLNLEKDSTLTVTGNASIDGRIFATVHIYDCTVVN